ncbi:heptaprenylglyceryl phosphate synthase [Thermoflavimicrobium dichotomicum]|uniref:Heptaprenylglyceryl phosphate synthase n=1 Tax=Thermoflavimicrobium dichotomicum TaxID=46223 RepID=A0A1I3RI47_9BACL|nr:heptaprenylglyceryl phosphate synthase [Thermoflavimicrobium dichotomicum]SFJ45948.1 putative glycerol-1-phosphate prenyltransferase [Thermoflavimicrobium dichotomicum]
MLRKKIKKWRHVFKLDPNRLLSDLALKMICTSGTDAIIIGGTDGVTFENTFRLLERVKKYPVYCVQEISNHSAVVPGFDGYLIPSVLNTDQSYWIKGAHFEAIRTYGSLIPWNQIVLEGYVILNPEAKVARLTKCDANLQARDVTAYARLCDQLFRIPVFYLEYSGTYGKAEIVKAARKGLQYSRLFYGGGITDEQQAKEMAAWADTVIVGNLVYYHVEKAVSTVKWVKETKLRALK